MTEHSRRSFVERTIMGIAGGALLLGTDRDALGANADELSAASEADGEDCWRLVQRGFRLEPGLVYLNNASLSTPSAAISTPPRPISGCSRPRGWGSSSRGGGRSTC